MKHIIVIDLARFGSEGIVEMRKPGMSRQTAKKNAMGRCGRASSNGKNVTLSEPLYGDLEVIEVLSFVSSAPFRPTVSDFLAYCDVLDEATEDLDLPDVASVMLYDSMSEAVNELRASSPFAGSQSAETGSLE